MMLPLTARGSCQYMIDKRMWIVLYTRCIVCVVLGFRDRIGQRKEIQ